jgi:AcrR family transcriptional regulator
VAQPAPRRQTRAEKKAETRERLLAAAERIAVDQGFARITLEAVAEAAGLTKGAIYSNFESKEDLILEIVQRVTPGLDLTPAVEGAADIATLLARTAEAIAVTAGRRSKQIALAVEFDALALRDPKLRRAMSAALTRERASNPHDNEDWFAERGLEPPIPADQFVEAISAVGIGLLTRRALYGPKAMPDELIAWIFARLGSSG